MIDAFKRSLVSGLLGFALLGCQAQTPVNAQTSTAPATQPPATTVKVAVTRVARKPLRQIVEQPAYVEALESTPLYAKVSGYVAHVAVDMGDRVRGPKLDAMGQLVEPGQTLVTLAVPELQDDLRRREALVAQARAGVAQAQAAIVVAEAEVTSAQAQIAAADATIAQSKAHVERTQSELKRLVALEAQKAIAAPVVDEAREAAASAQAQRAAAEAQRGAAQAQVTQAQAHVLQARADLAASEARVQVAEAEQASARTLVDYATLRAPFAGVVSRRNVHTGHLVSVGSAGAPLLELARIDVVRVFIDVPEAQAALVDVDDQAVIRFPVEGGVQVEAKIARTSWSLDRTTRTLKAEVQIDNPTGRLRPGMYAHAALIVGDKAEARVLPAAALVVERGQAYCAAVLEGKIVRQRVQIGLRSGAEVEILDGLADDTPVVAKNTAVLVEGQAVEILP